MTPTYRIRRWDESFENAQSRRVAKAAWVPVPNKHDGKSYRRLIGLPNGPALYAAWMLILQVASKCPLRGVLADDDGPLTAEDLSAKTGCPSTLFVEAFDVLTGSGIGWLEVSETEARGHSPVTDSETTPSTDVEDSDCSRSARNNAALELKETEPNCREGDRPASVDADASADKGSEKPLRRSNRAKERFDPLLVVIPPELDTLAFRDAWKDWCDYRADKRKPVSRKAANQQLQNLASAGPDAAVAAIKRSIANDYVGLFPDSPKGQPTFKDEPLSGPAQWAASRHQIGKDSDVFTG